AEDVRAVVANPDRNPGLGVTAGDEIAKRKVAPIGGRLLGVVEEGHRALAHAGPAAATDRRPREDLVALSGGDDVEVGDAVAAGIAARRTLRVVAGQRRAELRPVHAHVLCDREVDRGL